MHNRSLNFSVNRNQIRTKGKIRKIKIVNFFKVKSLFFQ